MKSLNSYSPTTYKHFPVSFGFHLVLPQCLLRPHVRIGTPPPPLSEASAPLPHPRNQSGGGGVVHTRLYVRGWGSPNSDNYRKGLELCLLCGVLWRVSCGMGTPTKRQVTKRQVSKRLASKRQVYKTSGLQNVRFTKHQVSKRLVSKCPVFKLIYLSNKKYWNCQVCIPI